MRREVFWTAYAIQRAYERFGGPLNVEVPSRRILQAASCIGVAGARFSIRTKRVTFVCVVCQVYGAAIKTIFRTNKGRDSWKNNRERRKRSRLALRWARSRGSGER